MYAHNPPHPSPPGGVYGVPISTLARDVPAHPHELNYLHLRYFWVTACEGGVTKAATRLRLSPSTISTQIKLLESHFGKPLVRRSGRGIALTRHGEIVRDYADRIFRTGDELVHAVNEPLRDATTTPLRIGVSNTVFASIALPLIRPGIAAHASTDPLYGERGTSDAIVSAVRHGHLDLAIIDHAHEDDEGERTESVPIGALPVSLVGPPTFAKHRGADLRRSLQGVRLILPPIDSALRTSLLRWFAERGIHTVHVAEVTDTTMLAPMARAGAGVIATPRLPSDATYREHDFVHIADLEGLSQHHYAVVSPAHPQHLAIRRLLAQAPNTDLVPPR